MELDFEYVYGQTPLEEEEKIGLRIPSIATRAELDEYEQQNIEDAIQWVISRNFELSAILTEKFVKGLHKRMYGHVWSWAGSFRKTDKNLGVDKWQIQTALRTLLDDTAFWINNNVYTPDETTIRLKHRMVSIHCFPNGNGRHSRLMADIIINKIYKQPVFTWGTGDLVRQGDVRSTYLKAVKAADRGDITPLMEFARS